ncbi:uncharacterized protein J7T54_002099 [Emericellopsis cladophorae]|uniref:MARVEL domain-containing protein n=1 Tax=Emericellopsis cladophorae TaxID=2686198 RepID=A0A9P9Y4I0_9HYPO|nr:uncharacterized protein J7T54_002099 [Emericellopsis cladophorae]KAI6782940.1 hypothetical protein J7T54_002099 [Emericellopsis cladophorae]
MGFKLLQSLVYTPLLLTSIITFSINTYLLAILASHSLSLPDSIPAVEGISGASILYTIVTLILLSRLVSVPKCFVLLILNFAFAICWIYVSVTYRAGASGCSGDNVNAGVLGKGKEGDTVDGGSGGSVVLPDYGTGCRLQSAVLAVGIISIFFSLGAIAVELFLARQIYREKHRLLPVDPEYTNEHETKDETGTVTSTARKGFLARVFGKRQTTPAQKMEQDNILPEHTTPGELVANPRTDSFAPSEHTSQVGVAHGRPEPQRYELYSDEAQQQACTGYHGYSHQQRYDSVDNVDDQVSPQSPQRYNLQERTGGYQPAPDYRYEDGIYERR